MKKQKEMSKRLTALCGLYCGDCIPSHGELYATINELSIILSDLQFEHYAELKSHKTPIFKEYETFLQVMQAIADLKCIAPCTEGGCKPNCEIRECVLGREFKGCWECAGSNECKHLEPLKKIHPNLQYHLELIKKYGPDKWATKRKNHYWWQST